MPTLLAVGVLTFLIVADAPFSSLSPSTVTKTLASIGVPGTVALIAVSIAVAISLQPLQFRMVQLLEGYWPVWFPRALLQAGVRRQSRRRDRLVDRLDIASSRAPFHVAVELAQSAETRLRERFPAPERLLPTALGNALRAAEDSVGKRYGLESVVLWPRLFRLLPSDVRSDIDDEVTQLDVSCRLAITWLVAGVVGMGIVLRDPGALASHPLWLAICGLFVLARLSYNAAVESAIAQGVDVEVAVDLYRARVIDAMRMFPTTSLHQEQRVFGELMTLFRTVSVSTQDLRFRAASRAGGDVD